MIGHDFPDKVDVSDIVDSKSGFNRDLNSYSVRLGLLLIGTGMVLAGLIMLVIEYG